MRGNADFIPFLLRGLKLSGDNLKIVFGPSKHKVSQGYSPTDESAGSCTPFEMTISIKGI